MKIQNSATIRDVARQAGVSVATISRYLNDTAPIAPETAARVKQAMEELNFTPHPIARNLATRRTNTIGLLMPDIGRSFYTPMLRGIEASACKAGYDLLIHSTGVLDSPLPRRRALTEHNTDGLLVFVDALDASELARLNAIHFPIVLMHQAPPDGMDIPTVTIENQSGTCRVVEHLITEHNRKRIVFLRGPDGNEDSRSREEGYRLALHHHQVPFTPELISQGGFDTGRSFEAMKQLLERKISFDAVFTGDDDSAVGVMDALKQAGINVPGDVSVAGFDDSIFARLITPSLTTVRSPIEQVGHVAVEQLLRLIQGESAQSRTVLPVEVVLRESCGCQV